MSSRTVVTTGSRSNQYQLALASMTYTPSGSGYLKTVAP